MMQWLVTTPMAVGASIAALAAIVLGWLTYFISRVTIGAKTDEKAADLALQVFRILATLLALLLSLTFSDVNDELIEIRRAVDRETSQLGNAFRNLVAFDSPEATSVKNKLLTYIDLVVKEEWEALQYGELGRKAMHQFGEIKLDILNLRPTDKQQEILHERLIVGISEINETRASRLVHRGVHGAPAFIYVAIFGFVLTVALLSVYPPSRGSIVFLSFYCAFIGAVIYLTLGLAYNFAGFGAVSPEPLEYLAKLIRTL